MEFFINSSQDGCEIHVINKCDSGVNQNKVVIMINGAVMPINIIYDLEINGYSWMDQLARSYNVYAFDSRGWGKSEAPANIDNNKPIMTSEDRYADLLDVLAFIRQEVGHPKFNIVGWSAGCNIALLHASRSSADINSVICNGARWYCNGVTSERFKTNPYFTFNADIQKERCLLGIDDERRQEIMPDYMWEYIVGELNKISNPMEIPTGAFCDTGNFWFNHKSMYNPIKIMCPTNIIVGTLDNHTTLVMAKEIVSRLGNQKDSKLSILENINHYAMLTTYRNKFFNEVEEFLNKHNE